MRILWFPGNGAIYTTDNKYNGGGWTGALAKEILKNHSDIMLGMAIPWSVYMEDSVDNVKIYGLPPIKHGIIDYERKLSRQMIMMKRIVEDFKPDLIHVFGSEHTGGMVATVTDKPVVLHLQGILNFLKEAWLPQNMSWDKYIIQHPFQLFKRKSLIRSCETERRILSACRYFMGRTEMDLRVSRLLNPKAKYFYCSEMLRPEIYYSEKAWSFHQHEKKRIVSIISSPSYKGGDVILRTAMILKEFVSFDFEWHVYGISELKDAEKLSGISPHDVNVECRGVIQASQLTDVVNESDIFVHPSYIENSSNAVCEAQLLGIPVIACFVGGMHSIIEHNKTGVMVPASDPYMMASYILELTTDSQKASDIGKAGRNVALDRHNPEKILGDVVQIYNKILNND